MDLEEETAENPHEPKEQPGCRKKNQHYIFLLLFCRSPENFIGKYIKNEMSGEVSLAQIPCAGEKVDPRDEKP